MRRGGGVGGVIGEGRGDGYRALCGRASCLGAEGESTAMSCVRIAFPFHKSQRWRRQQYSFAYYESRGWGGPRTASY